jgi:hypothetical protein
MTMTATMTVEATAPTSEVPAAVIETILCEHLADPRATLRSCTSAPFAHEGTNDSTTFYRVTLTWTRQSHGWAVETATWILKHWRAGGRRDRTLGITQSREVLAWEAGWLRPSALPDGVIVPLIGVWRAPDNREAWLAMTDVSTELAAFPRMGLSAEQVISRSQAILAHLARFHALWERPGRWSALQSATWLRRPESYLWDMAPTYARALGRLPHEEAPATASAPPVWDGLSADLEAFLTARPADERRLWEHLLVDRQALVDGLTAYPQTLLHNDLDDRNIGLHWAKDRSALDQPDPFVSHRTSLVLIDWEWLALGPAALDVANILQRIPVLIMLGSPVGAVIPPVVWSDALLDGYFAHYRAAGGRCIDANGWRRACGLALIVQGLAQMPFMQGSLRRVIRGEIPPPQLTGIPPAVMRAHLQGSLPIMEQMEQRVIREARRWLV